MNDISESGAFGLAGEAERLALITRLQTGLVLREVSLVEAEIHRGHRYEDQDDRNAFHVSRGRPSAIIILFPRSTNRTTHAKR